MLKNKKRLSLPLLVAALAAIMVLVAIGCTGAAPAGWSGPVVSGQTLFIGDPQGDLLALNVANGTQRWAQQLTAPSSGIGLGCFGPSRPSSAIYGTASISGDLVYATSYNGKAYAFSAADGSKKWEFPAGNDKLGPIVSGPVASGNIIIFGDTNGKVYAVGATDGLLKWTFNAGGKVWSTPAVDGSTAYVAALDGRVYALSLSDGSLLWKTGRVGGMIATPVVFDNLVIEGSLDRDLYAFDKTSGAQKWRFSEAGNFFWSSPLISGTQVIAANTDGNVYALDAATGQKAWVSSVDKSISSTPTLAAGSLVVGGGDGNLEVLDPSNGNKIRSIPAGTSIEGPLTSSGTEVFARTRQGNTVYVKGFDISNGTSTLSAPLEAAPAQTTTSSGSSGSAFGSWQFILIIGLFIVLVFLLFSMRRPAKP